MRISLATLAVSMLVVGSPALAQTATAQTHWVKQPSSADMAAVFPLTGAHLGHGGRVQLSCAVQPDGSLARCDVLSEDPGDEGFGDAALKLVKLYTLASTDGAPMAHTTIAFPVKFSLAP